MLVTLVEERDGKVVPRPLEPEHGVEEETILSISSSRS